MEERRFQMRPLRPMGWLEAETSVPAPQYTGQQYRFLVLSDPRYLSKQVPTVSSKAPTNGAVWIRCLITMFCQRRATSTKRNGSARAATCSPRYGASIRRLNRQSILSSIAVSTARGHRVPKASPALPLSPLSPLTCTASVFCCGASGSRGINVNLLLEIVGLVEIGQAGTRTAREDLPCAHVVGERGLSFRTHHFGRN